MNTIRIIITCCTATVASARSSNEPSFSPRSPRSHQRLMSASLLVVSSGGSRISSYHNNYTRTFSRCLTRTNNINIANFFTYTVYSEKRGVPWHLKNPPWIRHWSRGLVGCVIITRGREGQFFPPNLTTEKYENCVWSRTREV